MSRIISFQGKTINGGEWVTGNLFVETIVYQNFGKQIAKHFYIEQPSGKNGIVRYMVIPETAGQYTNTVGKDGRKIHERDIVSNGKEAGEVYWDYDYNGWQVCVEKENGRLSGIKLDRTFQVVGHKYDTLVGRKTNLH